MIRKRRAKSSAFAAVTAVVMLGLVADWQGEQTGLLVSAALVGAVGLLFARYAPEQWRR